MKNWEEICEVLSQLDEKSDEEELSLSGADAKDLFGLLALWRLDKINHDLCRKELLDIETIVVISKAIAGLLESFSIEP